MSNSKVARVRADLEDGLPKSLLVPLQGEALGWTLGFGLFGAFALVFFSTWAFLPFLGYLMFLAFIGVSYTALLAYFRRCMNGVRAGRMEPEPSWEVPDFTTWFTWILPGLAVGFWLMSICGLIHVGLLLSGFDLTTGMGFGTRAVIVVACFIGYLPFPAAMALMVSWRTPLALLHVPAQLVLIGRAGWRYLVPALVSTFAGAVPFALIEAAISVNWMSAVALVVSFMLAGYVWGAVGASMGWLAYNDEGVAEILDAA